MSPRVELPPREVRDAETGLDEGIELLNVGNVPGTMSH